MMNLSEDLKKIFLAGIGAVALTAEKSKEIVDELVKKGELTIEQGKVINEELKRNLNETIQNVKLETDDKLTELIVSKLDRMNDAQLQAIKDKIAEMESQQK